MGELATLPAYMEPTTIEQAETNIIGLGRNMSEHAYLVGKNLLYVKGELDHGEYEPWIEDSMWFSLKTARRFKAFAKECDENGKLISYEPRKTVTVTDLPEWMRIFNVWNFHKLDERFGIGHPGNIPGQVNQNLNYYYTEPGDLVVDLFAGGGTTIDVCKLDGRECLAYDIAPTRRDILQWDCVAQGVPDFDAKLVFLDPPYWRQKKGEYTDDPTNLVNMELDVFHNTLAKIVKDCLERAEYVALIIGATQHQDTFIDHSAEMMSRIGTPHQRIIVPYTTQQYGGAHVNRAKEGKYMLNLHRDLMIWQSRTNL